MAPETKKKLCKNKPHLVREEEKGEEYQCDGCKTMGQGRKYICEACDGHFHHECIDFKPKFCPEMFKEEEKGGYSFKFMSLPPPRKFGNRKPNSKNCEACGMPVEGCHYYCKKTDKYLHPRCASLPKEIFGADGQVKLVLKRKGQVMSLNSSNITDCCNIPLCQSAKLPAAAAGLNGSLPGCRYISDDGEISFHVFCMLQIWFKNSEETETTNYSGGPKLLEGLDGNGQHISETIQCSKKNHGGDSWGAGTEAEELDKKDKRETTQDSKHLEKKGGGRDGGRGGAPKENGNNAKMELVKIDRDMQIEHKNSKKKKGGGRGGRKTEICLKIFEAALSAVISALIGDFSGLAGHAVVQLLSSFI